MTARTRCVWVVFMECREMLYGRRFFLNMKKAVYKSYVRFAPLSGCLGSSMELFHTSIQ